jgi:transposase
MPLTMLRSGSAGWLNRSNYYSNIARWHRWSRRFRPCGGVAFINAVTIVAEIGDFARFGNPRQLMAYVGLVPSEHSTGDSVRRGGITKAGNSQAHRALIEGAWTYRMQARISRKLHDRMDELPQGIRDTAWKAQVRLCARYRRLVAKGNARSSSQPRSPAR